LTKGFIAIVGGAEQAYGPTCAKLVFGTVAGCPDLTIHAAAGAGGGGAGAAGANAVPNNAPSAVRYILLRQELLPGYGAKVSRHPTLRSLLAAYRQNGGLSAAEVQQVVAFEALQHKKEKLKNLLDVHAAHHLLTHRIAAHPPASMEVSMRQSLHNFLVLTPAQLKLLNLGMPPTAFL